MLMPAILLTTACSNINDENTNKEGYTLPVTVNVTRQGDDTATKATYNETDKTLSFSAGDKLFVEGEDNSVGGAGKFAGTLDWVSDGTFSGDITTKNPYSGTSDELLTAASSSASALLLPDGYGTYGYFSIEGTGYEAHVESHYESAFATTKSLVVEQFSNELAYPYSHGFALSPYNAILNFTIAGLAASTTVDVLLTDNYVNSNSISKSVTTDGSGTATFTVGIEGGRISNQFSLTVGGKVVTLTSSSMSFTAGKIYNITRNIVLANVATSDLGKVIGADGKIYVNATAATDAGTTAVAMIAYVGSETAELSPYNHGLALALSDANGGNYCHWSNSHGDITVHTYAPNSSNFVSESGLQYNATHNTDTYPAFKAAMSNNGTAAPTGCSAWFLPSGYQLNQMINACKNVCGTNNDYTDLRDGFSGVGGTNLRSDFYWSSTESSASFAWFYGFSNSYGRWNDIGKGIPMNVRSALAF